MNAQTLQLFGQTLDLLPQRAAYWRETNTLLVADVHLGKAAAFRARGIALPPGTTAHTLRRLNDALVQTGAARLVVLGDWLHARAGVTPRLLRAVSRWRETHARLEIVLVIGNHDRHSGPLPEAWRIHTCDEPHVEPPFTFRHFPAHEPKFYCVAGHVHPAVTLRGPGRARQHFHCAWVRPDCLVLPSFGEFTGKGFVEPGPQDGVYLFAENEVIPYRPYPVESRAAE